MHKHTLSVNDEHGNASAVLALVEHLLRHKLGRIKALHLCLLKHSKLRMDSIERGTKQRKVVRNLHTHILTHTHTRTLTHTHTHTHSHTHTRTLAHSYIHTHTNLIILCNIHAVDGAWGQERREAQEQLAVVVVAADATQGAHGQADALQQRTIGE